MIFFMKYFNSLTVVIWIAVGNCEKVNEDYYVVLSRRQFSVILFTARIYIHVYRMSRLVVLLLAAVTAVTAEVRINPNIAPLIHFNGNE